MHQLNFDKGSDARNHIVRCSCGWSFASTRNVVRDRATMHAKVFAAEDRRWDNPQRETVMPFYVT